MDGGMSDNMPKFESGRTITVSPFDGRSDIGPKMGQEVEKKAHFINFHNQDLQVTISQVFQLQCVFLNYNCTVFQYIFNKTKTFKLFGILFFKQQKQFSTLFLTNILSIFFRPVSKMDSTKNRG